MADFKCDYAEQGGTLPISAETRFPDDAQGVGQWTEIVQWLECLDGDTTPDEIDQHLEESGRPKRKAKLQAENTAFKEWTSAPFDKR